MLTRERLAIVAEHISEHLLDMAETIEGDAIASENAEETETIRRFARVVADVAGLFETASHVIKARERR